MKIVLLIVLSFVGFTQKPVQTRMALQDDAYVALIESAAQLNQICGQFKAGQLPAATKDPLEAAIRQYNYTMSLYMSFHARTNSDSKQLRREVDKLKAMVAGLPNLVPLTIGGTQ